jgi:hypothetical protein
MPYAIKGPDGEVIVGTTARTEADAWRRWCSTSYIPHFIELGHSCVPVTVSEGEADALLQDILDFLNSDGEHAIHPTSSLHKRIDAYLKGKP